MKAKITIFAWVLAWAFSGFAGKAPVQNQTIQTTDPAGTQTVQQQLHQADVVGTSSVASITETADTLFFETFDNDAPGWVSIDQTDVGEKWYLDTYEAYGGSGESWRVADPSLGTNGGYSSHWYQVLDTDPITVTANAELTFYFRLKVEASGGEPTGYDGWDGVNVRISTDGGSTWSVLTPTSPAYTATSLYSFGDEFGEGQGVPGWNGDMSTWTQATFDLSSYSSESVIIRFAFCSDPAYDTTDDPSMFGWQVDDIEVSDGSTVIYANDGVESSTTAQNWAPVGGDYWHISDDVNAPSPTAVADVNDPNTGSYHTNMINEYISPYFEIPAGANEVLMDFSVIGSFGDDDAFPDVDYWGARVQAQGESTWRYISNVTQDPNGNNYVYSDAPTEWFTFADAYNSGAKVDLTPLVGVGDSARVKFIFYSDDDPPQGEAIRVDNVVVYTPGETRLVPTGLEATTGDGQVELTWDDLNAGAEQDFYYDDGTMESFIPGQAWQTPVVGAGWAVKFETSSPTDITKVRYMLSSGNSTYPGQLANIKIVLWDATGTMIYESDAIMPSAMDALIFHDVTDENITIDGMFYAGWTYTTTDFPYIALDSSSPTAGMGYAYHPQDGGSLVTLAGTGLDGNYAIRVTGTVGASGLTYNVYRRESSDPNFPDTPVAQELADAFYTDTDVTNGTEYYYAVSSVYPDGGESELSDEVLAQPEAQSVYEEGYDDGTAETGYSIGENGQFAVRITPEDYPVKVVRTKIYLNGSGGDAVLTLWDDDGENNMPGTVLLNTIWRNLEQGWNEKDISAADINISDGDFYLGIKERSATPPSGIDQSVDNGRSYYYLSDQTGWDALANLGFAGNLMYRALLDSAAMVGVADDNGAGLPQKRELAQNYPNPFNPTTTISFTLSERNQVTLSVYDVHGQLVRELVRGSVDAGYHQVTFDAQSIPSGMYFYRLTTGTNPLTKKMILLK